MLDLHCHVLPGIDDGPAELRGSIHLARAAADEGVRVIAATPHCRFDHPGVRPHELAGRCRDLQEELDAAGIDVRIVPAGEVDLVWGLDAPDEDLQLVSYDQRGTDLLLETPYGRLASGFEGLVFELALKGYRVTLAHPERNPSFQNEPERLADLARRGTLLQVTASSLLRAPKRSRSAALAHQLVKEGLATTLASDAHGAAAPDRASLRDGALAAAELVGKRRARWMVADAPAAILAGQPLPRAPHLDPPKRGLLARLGL